MFTAVLSIPAETPRTILLNPPLSDEEFERLCTKTESALLERTKEGVIRVNAAAGGITSSGNAEIVRQLGNWWITHHSGKIFDSSGGFFLPDGSVLSPDAAYITAAQLEGLTRDDLARILRLAPAFAIEQRSPSDTLAASHEKMTVWMSNGVQLGWLVDPYAREVNVYRRGASEPQIETGTRVYGSGPVEGFVLNLEEIWRCYE